MFIAHRPTWIERYHTDMDKRILVLSAYDALSHRRWREGFVDALPEYSWTVLALPPRHFSWRIRGNSLTWAYSAREILEQPYDLVVATSMTDLAALRGMVPNLSRVPNIVYFHENQFFYPLNNVSRHSGLEAKMVTLYTALCGDKLLFNTRFNQETFLQGVRDLLERFPDHVPSGIVERIVGRSDVLPVPLDDAYFTRNDRPSVNGPFTILWNHRWEYDKAPERFFNALTKLRDAGIDFRIHVIGQQFRERPKAFDDIERVLSARIGEWGQVDQESYRQVLHSSHAVVSNALHDFQGLSVLEAVASGCVPVVPNRLAYRELFDPEYRYASYPDDSEKEAEVLAQRLMSLAIAYAEGRFPTPPDVSHMSWRNLAPEYQKIVEAITYYCD